MTDLINAIEFILIAGVFFLATLLFEKKALDRQGRGEAYDGKETLSNIFAGLTYKLVSAVTTGFFAYQIYDHVEEMGLNLDIGDNVAGFLVIFLVVDFNMYVWHVFAHKVRYAWCSHAIHHSSPRFNFSTALRQNFISELNGISILSMIPLALIGFDRNKAILALEINLFYQYFLHTEMIRKLPAWYEAIFNTPSHHRVHHGRNPRQVDRNFGGVLILWDRLFGTFRSEEDAGVIAYGLSHRQSNTLNPVKMTLEEFISMWVDLYRYKDPRILWKRPDWVEETYRRSPGNVSPHHQGDMPPLKPEDVACKNNPVQAG